MPRLQSFAYALWGLTRPVESQANARIHLAAPARAIGALIFLPKIWGQFGPA